MLAVPLNKIVSAVEISGLREYFFIYAVIKHISAFLSLYYGYQSTIRVTCICCMQVHRCDPGQCDALIALAAAMRNAGG